MIGDAFALSEQLGTPVLLRPTTRICHGCVSLPIEECPVEVCRGRICKRYLPLGYFSQVNLPKSSKDRSAK